MTYEVYHYLSESDDVLHKLEHIEQVSCYEIMISSSNKLLNSKIRVT